MGSRTREALFDLLRGWFDDTVVLDLFAGVGTLGLEAASRGASRVICVEQDRLIARLLRENVRSLGCEDRVSVIEADALSEGTLAALPRPVDIIFCDPPFALVDEMEAPEARPRREAVPLVPAENEASEFDFEAGDLARAQVEARRRKREAARLDAMLANLRPLFGERGFLALRLPQPRRGERGRLPGFDGPELHGYGDQQWIHLYAPARVVSDASPTESIRDSSLGGER